MSQGDSEFIFDARLGLIVISNTANVGGMNTSRSPAPTPAPVNDLSQRGRFPGRLGTVLRVALAVVVMAAGVLVLLPLVPFGVLGKADSMAGDCGDVRIILVRSASDLVGSNPAGWEDPE